MAFSRVAALLLAGAASPNTLAHFEAQLASQDSATVVLQQWCALRHISDPAVIHASDKSSASLNHPPAALRRKLGIGKHDRIVMRHVHLSCGKVMLSEAWNWYVPSRLTAEMNTALAETDIPFGRVAAPLHFSRQPLKTLAGRAKNCPRSTISTHSALLRLPDGKPLALVLECYTAANLEP
ncbi:MAG: hypothetical protein ABIW31_06745 [Novosphingobium sp.]